jgi:tetratricopeptide (TPR) repeat protein
MFEEILLNNPDNIALRFYNGISYIETEKYDEAIKSFNLILENKDNLYIEHAEWYLALCYLKKEDVDEARKQLLRIANEEDGFYKEDAQKILEKLDK